MSVYKLALLGVGWRAVAIEGPPLDRNGRPIRVGDEVELADRDRDVVEYVKLRFVGLAWRRHEVFPWRVRVVS